MMHVKILLSLTAVRDFLVCSDGIESACNVGDLGLIPGLRRSPRERNGNPLQYSCLGESHGQRSLVGYSPWGRKELNTTEQLTQVKCQCI